MEKSWNQRYKESGTTLSYKEWRKREDEKMASFDGISADGVVIKSDSLANARLEMQKKAGLITDISNKTVFGINKTIIIVAGVIIIGAIGYKLYKNYQSK